MHSTTVTLPGGWPVQSIQQPFPSPDKRGGLASGRAFGHKTFAINRNGEVCARPATPHREIAAKGEKFNYSKSNLNCSTFLFSFSDILQFHLI